MRISKNSNQIHSIDNKEKVHEQYTFTRTTITNKEGYFAFRDTPGGERARQDAARTEVVAMTRQPLDVASMEVALLFLLRVHSALLDVGEGGFLSATSRTTSFVCIATRFSIDWLLVALAWSSTVEVVMVELPCDDYKF